MKDSKNPNLDYNLLIRPWKSLIGLYYVENNNFIMDLEILALTAISYLIKNSLQDIFQKNYSATTLTLISYYLIRIETLLQLHHQDIQV